MALRQYIGARYVPKFYENSLGTNEWTANTAYEPLTIVTRNGNSYTSKKTVPANIGAPESAPEYWASTGIYNAQIDEYRQEVADVVQDMAALEAATERKRRYILIADSYGVGVTNSATSGHGWTYYFKDILKLADDDCYISQNGGAGFSVPNNTFETLLDNTEATVENPDTITDIVVAGGFNDATRIDINDSTTSTALRTAISSFTTRAWTLYPNARIWISFIARSINHTVARINNTKQAKYVYDAFNALPQVTNIELDVQSYTTFYGGASETNINHFNQTGYNYIGHVIAQAVAVGSQKPAYVRYGSAALTGTNGVTIGTASLPYSISNRQIWLYWPANGISLTVGDNKPAAESLFEFGEIAAPFWGRGAGASALPVSGYVRRASGSTPTYENFTGILVFNQGKLYLRTSPINAAGSSFSDLSAVDQIRLLYLGQSMPLEQMF